MNGPLRPETVPARAEALDPFKWMKGRRAPSALLPGAEQIIPELVCPRCGLAEPQPHYAVTAVCRSCGLHRQWAAGYIFVWEEDKANAA